MTTSPRGPGLRGDFFYKARRSAGMWSDLQFWIETWYASAGPNQSYTLAKPPVRRTHAFLVLVFMTIVWRKPSVTLLLSRTATRMNDPGSVMSGAFAAGIGVLKPENEMPYRVDMASDNGHATAWSEHRMSAAAARFFMDWFMVVLGS